MPFHGGAGTSQSGHTVVIDEEDQLDVNAIGTPSANQIPESRNEVVHSPPRTSSKVYCRLHEFFPRMRVPVFNTV